LGHRQGDYNLSFGHLGVSLIHEYPEYSPSVPYASPHPCGGRTRLPECVERFQRHLPPGCVLVNGLGITEAGSVRHYFIDHETQILENRVPIGYPVENFEILLLDDASAPVACGHVGEIVIKSRYLSPSYWRRQALTQAKYLPDPHGTDTRLYLTGDLGLMHANGCLIHLGGKDFQVKIRGYRVELGEVETALLALDLVKEATVVARQNRPDDKRLVAYVVPAELTTPTVTALRRLLAAKLPDYMVPSAFVLLEALPRPPNGKVDCQALPAPGRSRPALENPCVDPGTPIEAALARLWCHVLGLEQVGLHDHFLDLGGHSLMATQIVSRVRETFHLDVPQRALLETPTVSEMAVVITQHMADRVEHRELSDMLVEMESLSEDEVQRHLADETTPRERRRRQG
jgi:acyl carrier protein